MSETNEQKGIGDVRGNTIGSAARFNAGKTRYDLLPTHLLKNTADVLAFGASKYSPWNWARGFPLSSIIGCIKRHIAAIERGEDIDPESGLPHMGHVGCNLVFFEHVMKLIEAGHTELDDRPREWFKYEDPNAESDKIYALGMTKAEFEAAKVELFTVGYQTETADSWREFEPTGPKC